ncbi:MAG: hypothetical protein KGL95_03800 [Patescibacteria group bacterium]|nr:hypothetical protein [Patescibacteria group bacterium]
MVSQKRSRFRTSSQYKELKDEKDLFRRRILFLGFLTAKLKENEAGAILVGGEAIDLYTAGTFVTLDIDLLVDNKEITEKLLNKFKFGKRENTLWFNSDLNIVIQVISAVYSGGASRLRKFKVKGYQLRVAAPEDIIQNRLYSTKFWKSNTQRDMEESVVLLKIFSDSIDKAYLDKLAHENDIVDFLALARKYALEV